MTRLIDQVDTENIIEIDDEVSTEYEITKILKQHPKDTVIFTNIKNSDMNIISGICNTRNKIAKSVNTTVDELTQTIINATNNPTPIETVVNYDEVYPNNEPADLSKIPILKYYPEDMGKYITAGVVIAKDPETKQTNASIHRMIVDSKDELGIRIVPRNQYTYYKKAEE